MYQICKEVRKVANKIGKFFLLKNNNDYEKTNNQIYRLGITRIDILHSEILIHTLYPGILIGRKGETIEELTKYLGKPIKIIEERDGLINHMLQYEDEKEGIQNICQKCKQVEGIIRQVPNYFEGQPYYGYFCDKCNEEVGGI